MSLFGQHFVIDLDRSRWDRLKDGLFDLLMIALSVSDTATDIYIAFTFWRNEQWSYLSISTGILSIAHLSYCVLFLYFFKSNCKSLDCWLSRFLSILLLFPISPFLPLIFYLSADPDSLCSHYLQSLLHFKVGPQSLTSTNSEQEDQSRTTELYHQTDPTKRWIQHNLRFNPFPLTFFTLFFSL